jgi:hypothetical protein
VRREAKRHAAFGFCGHGIARYSMFDVGCWMFPVQRSTLNAQRSTLNAQRSTLNAQRSTFMPVGNILFPLAAAAD